MKSLQFSTLQYGIIYLSFSIYFLFTGYYSWDNPRKFGFQYLDENNELNYAGPSLGKLFFASLEEMKYKDFLKGGSAVFVFSFEGRLKKMFTTDFYYSVWQCTANLFEIFNSLHP